MRMLKSKYILFAVFLLSAAFVSAQKAERDYIRKGNRLFNDSVFVDAEVNYRKALEVNPKSTVSMYNLGNTLSQQQKMQEAMEQYVSASNIEKDKMKLAQIWECFFKLVKIMQRLWMLIRCLYVIILLTMRPGIIWLLHKKC